MNSPGLKPLSGIKIVNLGFNLPGPLAALHLQKLGATVTKINPPHGDPLLAVSPEFYHFLCENQKTLTLDLKNEDDRKKLDQYLSDSDLLLTSLRPESLGRLQLDWPRLHSAFPRLCYLNIVGFSFPHQNKAGHDLTYQASAGLLQPPQMPATCLADFAGAHEASLNALALLFERERTGRGQTSKIALADSIELYASPFKYGLTSGNGALGGRLPEYHLYPTKDGWVAVAALEPHFKRKLMAELGLKDLKHEEVRQAMLKRTAADWEKWAVEKDLPIAAVKKI